jgi:hypothetical protein
MPRDERQAREDFESQCVVKETRNNVMYCDDGDDSKTRKESRVTWRQKCIRGKEANNI